jgi:hypothetical protein
VKVLKLSAQGLPQAWISLEQAVIHYAASDVRWEAGQEIAVFRGGHNAVSGEQSIITVNSIIGTRGVPNINPFDLRPGLTNGKLFARDRNVCAYCGDLFHEDELTREHIIPFAQNGQRPLDERGHRLPRLQPPQEQPYAGAGAHAAAVRPLCAQPVGRLHPAQPAHSGRPDGVPDGASAAHVAAAWMRAQRQVA